MKLTRYRLGFTQLFLIRLELIYFGCVASTVLNMVQVAIERQWGNIAMRSFNSTWDD